MPRTCARSSTSYGRAPYFEDIYPLYHAEVERAGTFVELTTGLIEAFARHLEIDTQRVRLSELGPGLGHKAQLVLDACLALEADVYLSGSGGGRSYNDEELLRSHGIELVLRRVPLPGTPSALGRLRTEPLHPRPALQLRSRQPEARDWPLTRRGTVAYRPGRGTP